MSRTDRGRAHTEVERVAGAVLGMGKQANAITQLCKGGDVDARDISNAHTIDCVGRYGHAKCKPDKDHELLHRVPPVNVERRIGFGKATALRVGERTRETHARATHLGEDHVGGAIDHAVECVDTVSEKARAQQRDDRQPGADTRLEVQASVVLAREGTESRTGGGDHRLVCSHHGLSGAQG